MHQQLMEPYYGTQYEENPASHHGGMLKNRLTDGQMAGLMDWILFYIPQFRLGRAGNNNNNNVSIY